MHEQARDHTVDIAGSAERLAHFDRKSREVLARAGYTFFHLPGLSLHDLLEKNPEQFANPWFVGQPFSFESSLQGEIAVHTARPTTEDSSGQVYQKKLFNESYRVRAVTSKLQLRYSLDQVEAIIGNAADYATILLKVLPDREHPLTAALSNVGLHRFVRTSSISVYHPFERHIGLGNYTSEKGLEVYDWRTGIDVPVLDTIPLIVPKAPKIDK